MNPGTDVWLNIVWAIIAGATVFLCVVIWTRIRWGRERRKVNVAMVKEWKKR